MPTSITKRTTPPAIDPTATHVVVEQVALLWGDSTTGPDGEQRQDLRRDHVTEVYDTLGHEHLSTTWVYLRWISVTRDHFGPAIIARVELSV